MQRKLDPVVPRSVKSPFVPSLIFLYESRPARACNGWTELRNLLSTSRVKSRPCAFATSEIRAGNLLTAGLRNRYYTVHLNYPHCELGLVRQFHPAHPPMPLLLWPGLSHLKPCRTGTCNIDPRYCICSCYAIPYCSTLYRCSCSPSMANRYNV